MTMSDFDNFLDSLDVNSSETHTPSEEMLRTEETNDTQESTQSSNSLSEEDFNNILSDMGFEEALEEEYNDSDDGTEQEEDDESYNENLGEGRDLDAEEDADWEIAHVRPVLEQAGINNLAVSGSNQVHFHTGGELVSVPVIHESAQGSINTEEEPRQEEESQLEGPLIPPNSPTLLIDDSTSRFSGAEWYEEIKKQRIILAGIGGIGSWTALQLARMSPAAIFLYDDDVVEMANMSGQLYATQDIGLTKVDAIANTLHSFTTAQNIYALSQRFTSDTEAGDIMICGFDNMKARKAFFEAWAAHIENKSLEEKKKCLYIDGRLSMDTLQVFCIRGDDQYNCNRYLHHHLFSDEEADPTVCSMKQTTYLACMIGSIIVNVFTNHIANLLDPVLPYDLPFFTEYDSQNMIFKTEN